MKNSNEKSLIALRKKLELLELSPFLKKTFENLVMEPISFVVDPKFRRPKVMVAEMATDVQVHPGKNLTLQEERTLFTQMNYSKFRSGQIRRKLLSQSRWTLEQVQELLNWHQRSLDLRSRIVTANMGLVLAMAKRTHFDSVDFTDLISEGSMALLRATEKFDCLRGLKFSTYACQAILKGFSRAAKDNYRHRNLFPTQLDTTLEKDDSLDQQRTQSHLEMVDEVRAIFRNNVAELSDTEYRVVDLRFSLTDGQRSPLTLKEVGAKLGLTKERIRQIQNQALSKLRQASEERMAGAAVSTI